MPHPRRSTRPFSFEIKREYNKKLQQKGKLSEIIDFHVKGRNRYMKINQPTKLKTVDRDWTRFKNPLLNRYDVSEEDDGYERKHYVFEYIEEDDENTKDNDSEDNQEIKENTKTKKKSATNKNTKRLGGTVSKSANDKSQRTKKKSNDEKKVDEKKVGDTVKMLEGFLKESQKPKKKPQSAKLASENDQLTDKSNLTFNSTPTSEETFYEVKEVSEEEKNKLFQEKNIQVNISTMDNDNVEAITKKPEKTSINKELKTISTQTPRDIYFEMSNDHLQYAADSKSYINKLVEDVDKISKQVKKEKDLENKNHLPPITESPLSARRGKKSGKRRTINSLGLTMEGKNGVKMAIIKGIHSESETESNADPGDKSKSKMKGERKEEILLKQNYQNLEDLINHLNVGDADENYLKIAKLKRLKVLMEMSMQMVGRKYNDISSDERTSLESQANRFHSTYPLPGEEKPLEEIDEKGFRRIRMPLKIVEDEGAAKIDINNKYLIDPKDFLAIYANKMINHAQDSTGLEFDNITLTIPATYGTQQREAIKNSVNEGADRNDVQILTRPVAAAVALNDQRNESETNEDNRSKGELDSKLSEKFKVVFDITDRSMDASVIRVKEAKDFQVISNVGDASFGVNDVDQRIVEYIVKEKEARDQKADKKTNDTSLTAEIFHSYSHLIKSIKNNITYNDAAVVDLVNMNEKDPKHKAKSSDEIVLNKPLISKTLCKDIYDWSLAHIQKAIHQADVLEDEVDEVIVIGGKDRLPGFYEYLQHAFPKKTVTFVDEEDLAVGAALVGKKLKYQQIKITEVLCRSIGIGLYTGVITYLLFRNSSLPCVGGCVYSTLVDDQESMVLDVYEGERPHVKFCRYLGEVTINGLPKGEAGRVKCELHLKMNSEGLLEVSAKELNTGTKLETVIDANPEHLTNEEVNNETELDPIEAERYKKPDYNLVYELESLDQYLEDLSAEYRSHKYSRFILDKIFDTKEWLYKNRRKVSSHECAAIRNAIGRFLKNMKSLK